MRLRVTAPARPTFDTEAAQEVTDRAAAILGRHHEVVGTTKLVLDNPDPLDRDDVDAIVVLQASFADSSITLSLLGDAGVPVLLWGFPEPRTGGRLGASSSMAASSLNRSFFNIPRKGRANMAAHSAIRKRDGKGRTDASILRII